jgi:hypothetical protein
VGGCCVLPQPPERPQSAKKPEPRGSLVTTKLSEGRRIVSVLIERFNLRSSHIPFVRS